MEFKLTADHLALIGGLQWSWDSSPPAGVPCVNLRQPYGGTTVNSIARLIGCESKGVTRDIRDSSGRLVDCVTEYPPAVLRRFYQLHLETAHALEIVLSLRTFEPGLYVKANGRWAHERQGTRVAGRKGLKQENGSNPPAT